MRRRPTRPGMTRVGTAGTPVPRRTGSAFEGRPAPRPAPMPTRGGMGMNPSGPAPRPAPVRPGMKKGGKVKKIKKGGSVSSCSKRADGCIIKGKTKGRII